ncbi:MAG TPA: ribonuclease III [Planctomycetaceae bacterium]|jgi:ribonuclease-3|nr:ribonuclease III [Planctomycetaceae bacterium]
MSDDPTSNAPSDDKPSSSARLRLCEERIGYDFHDKNLVRAALTHASGASHRLSSNERLEFLGDAILGFVVCEALYGSFPDLLEGDLTKIKSVVVSRETCARISQALGIEELLIVGKGMTTVPSVPRSLLSDVFEALVAAIYLDGGMIPAREFILKNIRSEIESASKDELFGNYKSQLQQVSQRKFGNTPSYELLDEKGPDHAKCFQVGVQVGGEVFAPAWGKNKKEAEQRAACNALCELNGEPAPYTTG